MSTSVAEARAEARAENGSSNKVSLEDKSSDNIKEAESNGTMNSGPESVLPVKAEKEVNATEQSEQVLDDGGKLTSTEEDIIPQKPVDNDFSNKESLETKNVHESQSSNNIEKREDTPPTTIESEVEKPSTELSDKKNEECVEDKKPVLEKEKEVEKTDEEKMDVEEKKEEKELKGKDGLTEVNKDTGKQGLPKWMVQSANAPPSPSPELAEKTDEKQAESTAPVKRRGRGRRSMAEKAAEKQKQINDGEEGQSEEALSPRPRRSTRSRVDYANPDPMTVVAEADDDEPGGGAKRMTRNAPGRKPIVGRGRKRKVTSSDDEDGGHYEDDDDEDYGSKKRVAKKRSNACGVIGTPASGGRRGRGRPASGKSSGNPPTTKGRFPRGGVATKRKTKHDYSDEEQSDVIYDDRESDDKDPTTEDDSADEKQQSTIPVVGSKTVSMKGPLKKRGRPPAGARNQKQSVTDDAKDHQIHDNDSNDDG